MKLRLAILQHSSTPFFSLQFNFNVDARGQIQFAEGIDRLLRRLENIDQALVGANLELLARFLIDVRRAVDGKALDARRQRNRPGDPAAGAPDGLDDLAHRLVEHAMVVSLQANADLLVHGLVSIGLPALALISSEIAAGTGS